LYQWLDQQRREAQYLTHDQIARLDALGSEWRQSYGEEEEEDDDDRNCKSQWHCYFEQLKKFYDKYGHVNVAPKSRLGQWVALQYRHYRLEDGDHSLTQSQRRALESVGFRTCRQRDGSYNGDDEEKNNASSVSCDDRVSSIRLIMRSTVSPQ